MLQENKVEESEHALDENKKLGTTNYDTNVSPTQKITKKLSNNEKEQVEQALSQHYLFKDKSKNIIASLLNKIEMIKVSPNTILFKEGDTGDYFYIIKKGTIEITSSKEKTKKYLKEGDTFGELALLERKKRTATVKSVDFVILYELNGKIFRDIVTTINQHELKDRLEFIALVPIFESMESVQLNTIASSMNKYTFDAGTKIIDEGEVGDCLYIIRDGEVSCEKDKQIVRSLKSKEYFGEYAVLFDIPRSLSVIAKTKTTCFKIGSTLLIDTLGKEYKKIILKSICKEAFKNSVHLKILHNDTYNDAIYNKSTIKLYNNGETILSTQTLELLNLNNEQKKLFVIICGNIVEKSESEEKVILAKRSQLFGENYIKPNSKLNKDAVADGEVRLIEMEWNTILDLFNIKAKNSNQLSFFSQLEHLKTNDLFRNTSDNRLMKICTLMTKERYKEGDVIVKEGDIGDKFYLIKNGKVKVLKDKKVVREMESGACFGEMSLLINEKRSATIIAQTKCSFYILTKSNFLDAMDKNIIDYLYKKIALQDNFNMNLNDLYFVKNLGQGKFGSVSLVHNKKHYYAIKAVSRLAAERQKILIKYFLEERRVLIKIDHPFIMKLVKTFKNNENVFYLTELVNGKVLGKYLEKKPQDKFQNKAETQFYIAFLFVILDYLNSKCIIHRDLKPDNIMLDEKGYIKLIDFGTAMTIKDFTSTITGTPHYIAPEVLLGKGYSYSCDYWSIGIITHEIYYNYYPFGNDASDPMEVYREVLKREVSFTKGDSTVNSFLKALLKKKVSKRLCSLDGAKKHNFFKDFNWGDLIDFQMSPPYVPKVANLKKFEDCSQTKYIDHLKLDMIKKNQEDTLLSSYDDDGSINYPQNWVDEFN